MLAGLVECGNIGAAVVGRGEGPVPGNLGRQCCEHNKTLVASLKEDEHASRLLDLTRQDASLGRMSSPVEGGLLCLFEFYTRYVGLSLCS